MNSPRDEVNRRVRAKDTFFSALASLPISATTRVGEAVWSLGKIAVVTGALWITLYYWLVVHRQPPLDLATGAALAIAVVSVGLIAIFAFLILAILPGILLRNAYTEPESLGQVSAARQTAWRLSRGGNAACFLLPLLLLYFLPTLHQHYASWFPITVSVLLIFSFSGRSLARKLKIRQQFLWVPASAAVVIYSACIDILTARFGHAEVVFFLTLPIVSLSTFFILRFPFRKRRLPQFVSSTLAKLGAACMLIGTVLPAVWFDVNVQTTSRDATASVPTLIAIVILLFVLNLVPVVADVKASLLVGALVIVIVALVAPQAFLAAPLAQLGIGGRQYTLSVNIQSQVSRHQILSCLKNGAPEKFANNGHNETVLLKTYALSTIGSRWIVANESPAMAAGLRRSQSTSDTGAGNAKDKQPHPFCTVEIPATWIQVVTP